MMRWLNDIQEANGHTGHTLELTAREIGRSKQRGGRRATKGGQTRHGDKRASEPLLNPSFAWAFDLEALRAKLTLKAFRLAQIALIVALALLGWWWMAAVVLALASGAKVDAAVIEFGGRK